jgi:cytochrome c biogenesis protein CcmG/thiol:disulfide interchange protein DsbE
MRAARWVVWGVVAASALLALVFVTRFGSSPTMADSPLIGGQAPNVTLPYLEGDGSVELADLRGDIVVVNFFASWCLQCRNEHEDLVSTADAFADSGVQFVEITYQDSVPEAVAFLDEFGRSQSTIYASDPRSRAAIAFGVFGIPETFFIDEEGSVVGKIIGESNALVLGNAIDAIKRGERPGQQVVGETETAP